MLLIITSLNGQKQKQKCIEMNLAFLILVIQSKPEELQGRKIEEVKLYRFYLLLLSNGMCLALALALQTRL